MKRFPIDAQSALWIEKRGRTVRLESPLGTFSYYDPEEPFTCCAWDSLSASILLAKRRIRKVLILGLGGGTVARQVRLLLPESRIVGVESDIAVIRAAYRFFELKAVVNDVVHESATTFVERTKRSYDLILDDVWPTDESERPIHSYAHWLPLLASRLKKGGVYGVVVYRRSANADDLQLVAKRLKTTFSKVVEARPKDGHTTVLVAGNSLEKRRDARAKRKQLRKRLAKGLAHVKYYSA